MKNSFKTTTLVTTLTLILLILAACTTDNPENTLLPSEAQKELQSQFQAKRAELPTPEARSEFLRTTAEDLLTRIQASDISSSDQLALAELHQTAGNVDTAKGIIQSLLDANAPEARQAMKLLIDIEIENEQNDVAEKLLTEFRNKFEPDQEDPLYLYYQVGALAEMASDEGDHARAISISLEEISSLPLDYPYASLNLLAFIGSYFQATDRLGEYRDLLKSYKSRIEETIALRNDTSNEDEEYQRTTKQLEKIVMRYDNSLTQLELIGQQAPALELSNFTNADPLTLDDLSGKVVMIDFWANWCGPCKRAFPAMKSLYEKYREQGFVILGVTSFQGFYNDNGVREENISEEKELELTAEFIKRHQMIWPIAFSSRSVYDPEYGVSGIPTFAIIDKNGIVRKVSTGMSEAREAELGAYIEQLLAE